MHRRHLLKIGVSLAAPPVFATPAAAGDGVDAAARRVSTIFIPGYSPEYAYAEGLPVLEHPAFARALPAEYAGPASMLTRLDPKGDIRQALFPVAGHGVAIAPSGKLGFYGAMEGGRHTVFDTDTLDLIATGDPPAGDWVGGGHGVFSADGQTLFVSERAPLTGYLGTNEKHFGRLTLRDPKTLQIVETYSCHGVSPHDIRLMPGGTHIAVANYGTTYPAGRTSYGLPRHIVEPSITIVDLADGTLVDKIETGSKKMELRHLCAANEDSVFAIQIEPGERADELLYRLDEKVAYEVELSVDTIAHLPAAVLLVRRSKRQIAELGSRETQTLMRHGLSVAHDDKFSEVIATFPGSHRVMVFDASTGEVRRNIDCAALGLDHPSGLAIVPGGNHYIVTGYWKNLFVFRRGTHELVRELCAYTTFFGHSHIAVG
jgi:hypothetical protein